MGEGIGIGFEDAMATVSRDMRNAVPTRFNMDAGLSISPYSTLSSGKGTTINQTISITTPKALSEKELAREFKNLSRKLALEY
jgi:hypothetical protein